MIHSSEEFKTHMTTMSGVLEKLRLKKIDNEFKLNEEGFTAGKGKFYKPEELKIIRTYRFEGESDPEDNSAIYLIEATDGLIGYTRNANFLIIICKNKKQEYLWVYCLSRINVPDRSFIFFHYYFAP
jgi:hypothetical protein